MSGSITNGTAQVAFGNQPASAGPRAFDGLLDEVCLYDQALSAAEITGMMSTGCGGSGNPPTSTASPTPLPNATATASPTPPPANDIAKIQRTYYALGGQLIGVRVKEIRSNGTTKSDKLYYTYADHLDNVTALSDANGNYVSNSLALFRPFGSYRLEPQTNPDITDRGFTGHKENLDIGLTYMNARYYLGYINRFISADPIVPNPKNPQSLNRYTYGLNNPLRFTDPTGFRECEFDGNCLPTPTFHTPFFNFTGNVSLAEKQMAHQAAGAIGQRMASVVNPLRRMAARIEGTTYTPLSATDAFLGAFDGPITIQNVDKYLVDAAGFNVYAKASLTQTMITIGKLTITNHQLFIHEIFHVLDIMILGNAGNQNLLAAQQADATFPNRPNLAGENLDRWGFAGGNFSNWQKSRSGASGEEFADMGIGWTYNQWEGSRTGVGWSDDGKARANFMDVNMGIWLSQLLP